MATWEQYFAANPDVAAAYQTNPYGLTQDQFAQVHYQNYGQPEGRGGFGMTPLAGNNEISIGRNAAGYADAGAIDQYQGALGANTGHLANPDGSYTTLGGGSAGRRPQPFAGGTYSGWQNTVARQRGQLPPAGGPQVMPGVDSAWNAGPYTPPTGTTASTQGWNSPPVDPNSATAKNPFLNLGLNAFGNTQQGFDTSWLDNVGKSLYDQANQNYLTNLKPTLDSNAIMASGYGGDRAALAQGVVMDRGQQNVLNAMAPQYANAYENSMNRALQGGQAASQVGMGLEDADLRRMLGMGQLSVQQQNADTGTAQVAANSAGVPTYTNPWAAGVGGAGSILTLLNLLFGTEKA